MHVFWITSRAAGIVALLASSLAVALGLMMARRSRLPDLRVTHEALSLATIAAIVVHALALLGDSFLKPSLADIAIPFASGYQRLWTTTGIVAGWMLILLGLSYYFRARIGPARWRSLHRFTALAWVLGVVHAIGEGTDAGTAWFLAAAAAVVVPAGALLAARLAPAT
jgi:sulfoxide reductase heme-binding subunit YedZ